MKRAPALIASLARWAFARLGSEPILSLCLVLGIVAAVGVATTVPMYSGAVMTRMLRAALDAGPFPPFSVLLQAAAHPARPEERDRLHRLDHFITTGFPASVSLPPAGSVRHLRVTGLGLFPLGGSPYGSADAPVDWLSLGFLSGLESHVRMIEGRYPREVGTGEPLEVMLTRTEAEKLGIQVGETYLVQRQAPGSVLRADDELAIPARVCGIWEPRDNEKSFWFYRPEAYDLSLLTTENALMERVAAAGTGNVVDAFWFFVFDGSAFHVEETPRFLQRIAGARSRLAAIDPSVSIAASPVEAMQSYLASAGRLTTLLLAFTVPLLGLILAFIILISGLAVERQKNEMSLARSRGTSRGRVMASYVIQGVILACAAAPLGGALAIALTRWVGRVRTFLQFTSGVRVDASLSGSALLFALLTAALAVVGMLLPALPASRATIVTYKREQARERRKPFWERYYVDVFLFVFMAYGAFVMLGSGARGAADSSRDAFRDPILFLVPALFVLVMALFFLRLLPVLLELASRLAGRGRRAPLALAARSLARAPRRSRALLLIVILTTGLAAYTASMALTLDSALTRDRYYAAGADFRVMEKGVFIDLSKSFASPQGISGALLHGGRDLSHFEFPPLGDYAALPGVEAATRMGTYEARADWSASGGRGMVVGIERDSFARVGFFPTDFAPVGLSDLMRSLSVDESAVLVQRRFFEENRLRAGQRISVSVTAGSAAVPMEFIVTGVFDAFPAAAAGEGPVLVVNLGSLFYQAGSEFPYSVLLKASPLLTRERLLAELQDRGLSIDITNDPRGEIQKEKESPERQGLYGLLSIGFLTAAFMISLGFLLFAVSAYKGRSIELGILRAVGLSIPQMIGFVFGEQLGTLLAGVAGGTALGTAAALLFLPSLQSAAGTVPGGAPFLVQIAWTDMGKLLSVFAAMLIVAMLAMVRLLLRLSIFQAIKLDEVG